MANLQNQLIREQLSIELCDNFTKRLDPRQTKEIKIGALIAIRNFIKESLVNDPIIYSFLVDTMLDPDKEVRRYVVSIIKEVINPEIKELLEIKLVETSGEIKTEINNLLR